MRELHGACRRLRAKSFCGVVVLFIVLACTARSMASGGASGGASDGSSGEANVAPLIAWRVVAVRPHDPAAFTQGLLFHKDLLFESTGLRGRSELRAVRPEDGSVLRRIALPAELFGEGLTRVGSTLYQLSWQAGRGFVYSLDNFRVLREFRYAGEGWGLAWDGSNLLMSDGSAQIRVLDASRFEERHRITVHHNGAPLRQLNELEMVRGALFANVWRSDRIARINLATGQVTGWLNLRNLLGPASKGADVLNGIAWDESRQQLWVTGKLWPKIFVLEIDR
ncbi:MAG: glutamine cyclotransferase [Gammaproteobacteria bacterium]